MIYKLCRLFCLAALFSLFSCSRPEPDITGVWSIENDFFRATYQLSSGKAGLSALVLHYDDGTTRINYDAQRKQYLFKGLAWQKQSFVDGISGATRKEKAWNFRLIQKAEDTLLVEQQIAGRVLREFWIRSEEAYEIF